MIFSHIISIYLLFLSCPVPVTLYLSCYSSISTLLLLSSSLIDTSYRILLMLMLISHHMRSILLLLCSYHYSLLYIFYSIYFCLFLSFHYFGFILLPLVVFSMRSFTLLLSNIPIFYLMRSQLSSSITIHQLVLIYSLLLYRIIVAAFLTLKYFLPFSLFSRLPMFSFYIGLQSVVLCSILIFYLFLLFFIGLRRQYFSIDLIHENFQYVNFHLCQQVIVTTSFNQD